MNCNLTGCCLVLLELGRTRGIKECFFPRVSPTGRYMLKRGQNREVDSGQDPDYGAIYRGYVVMWDLHVGCSEARSQGCDKKRGVHVGGGNSYNREG